jgi:hypothetical protein
MTWIQNLQSLPDHILRALNKIRKPSTTDEITDLLSSELELQSRPAAEGSSRAVEEYGTTLLVKNPPAKIAPRQNIVRDDICDRRGKRKPGR